MYVTADQKRAARKADLFEFLCKNYPDQFKKEGKSLRMKSNSSVSIKRGYTGYTDFSSQEHGNSIDFLVRYLNYDFVSAVVALSGSCPLENHSSGFNLVEGISTCENKDQPKSIDIPKPAETNRQMFAYLHKRGITYEVIHELVNAGLLYQSADYNNAVFMNKEKDYCELRGTYTYAKKPFHGCRKASADRFWGFKIGKGSAEKAFICEAAIDAISLYLLQSRRGDNNAPALYISIGGVANQQTIDRIKTIIPEQEKTGMKIC